MYTHFVLQSQHVNLKIECIDATARCLAKQATPYGNGLINMSYRSVSRLILNFFEAQACAMLGQVFIIEKLKVFFAIRADCDLISS